VNCIFCDCVVKKNSEEHIIPESLGNERYVLEAGAICSDCNNKFSKFENIALTKTVLGFERARLGIKSKKGNPAKAKTGQIEVEGNPDFKKDLMTLKGLKEESVSNINYKDRTFQVTVPGFEDSASATSKLILKIGYESIFQSQKELYKSYNFSDLKIYLQNKINMDWSFMTSKLYHYKFKSVPTFYDKHMLNKIHCILSYSEISKECLLFNFKYGGISMFCNLINRNIEWVTPFLEGDSNAQIYPKHLMKKTK
jgi:hypothetical protein